MVPPLQWELHQLVAKYVGYGPAVKGGCTVSVCSEINGGLFHTIPLRKPFLLKGGGREVITVAAVSAGCPEGGTSIFAEIDFWLQRKFLYQNQFEQLYHKQQYSFCQILSFHT